MFSDTQLAYFAGIIDGEGTFYISPAPHFRHRILVVNTDKKLIDWLQNVFGGLVYSRKNKKHPNWKLKYEWLLCKSDIIPICKKLIPFLVTKKEQAEIMVELRKTFEESYNKSNRVPETILFIRTQCKSRMSKLNNHKL